MHTAEPVHWGNIGRLLVEAARSHGVRAALRHGDQVLSYVELNDRVNRLAAGLRRLGLRQGDRVLVWLKNCPELLETMFACWKLGLAVVPVNHRLTAAEVDYQARDCTAAALVHGDEFTDGAAQVGVAYRIRIGGRYAELLAVAAGEQTRDIAPETPAWLFYTSGTTGQPKGAVLTHRALGFAVVSWCADLYPMQPEDVVLHCSPLSHGAGFHAITAIARGAQNVLHARWDPAVFCADVAALGITATWLVPTQLRMLLDHPELATADLGSLRSIVYGGSAMYQEDLEAALQRFGPVLCQLYGQGEAPMTLSYLRPAAHRDPNVLTSAGVARTGMELRIADEYGAPVPTGVVGEILGRGPVLMTGYWGRPDATAQALRDGWLHTGDLGRMDDRGYLYVLDRKKDFVISGGSNVYPREVEEVLLRHSGIHEAAVFGVPDRLWGEAVTAAVVGDGLTETGVIAYCRANLADYKSPKKVYLRDELPKNAYGKVLKRELRELYRPTVHSEQTGR